MPQPYPQECRGAPLACSWGRIVGYSIDSRMKSRLAVATLNSAVARRDDVTGCVLHSDRGSQFRSKKMQKAITRHGMLGRPKAHRGKVP